MKDKQLEKLTSLFFEIGTLRKIPRSHQQTLLSQDLSDNIASHSFRTALIGYFLTENLEADSDKVTKMCLLHDLEEVRTGDQNWLHKSYVKSFEGEVREDQVEGLENVEEFEKLSQEYDERETLEAKIAKDADCLDQLMLLKEYAWQGNEEAKEWLHLDKDEKNEQEKRLHTDLAQQLAREVKQQKPSSWWRDSWSSEGRGE